MAWPTDSEVTAAVVAILTKGTTGDSTIPSVAEWSYEITPKRGRLHIAAQLGRMADGQQPALLLQTTARGPVGKGGADTLRAGLDLGHDMAVETFMRVTSDDVKARWGEQK